MGSWRDFREPDLITFYKQLHAVDSVTSQVIGNCPCNFHRTLKGFIRHGMRLPGLPVIAILLAVTDRVAERDPIAVTNGQQRDLIVKVNKTFNDDPPLPCPAAGLRIIPGRLDIRFLPHQALPLRSEERRVGKEGRARWS